ALEVRLARAELFREVRDEAALETLGARRGRPFFEQVADQAAPAHTAGRSRQRAPPRASERVDVEHDARRRHDVQRVVCAFLAEAAAVRDAAEIGARVN